MKGDEVINAHSWVMLQVVLQGKVREKASLIKRMTNLGYGMIKFGWILADFAICSRSLFPHPER